MAQQPAARARSHRILLGDDDASLHRAFERAAAQRGHQVLHATTGARTIALAIDSHPDLIVLDMTLPDADGRDVLIELKRDARTAGIPVVVWSGKEAESESKICLKLGAEEFAEKGSAFQLIEKINRLMFKLDGALFETASRDADVVSGFWRIASA